MAPKQLMRSNNKIISGVCGGLAEYAEMDYTLVRVLFVVASLMMGGFTGIILYVVLVFLLPEPPQDGTPAQSGKDPQA